MADLKENNVTFYSVPSNVSTKFEFFPGFGWFELKYVGVALIVGALLFFITGLFTTSSFVPQEELTLSQKVGLDEGELKVNPDGMVEIKKEAVPMIVRVLLVIIPSAGAFFFVRRDPSTNMSLIYNLRGASEFKKRQRLYLYKYNSGSED